MTLAGHLVIALLAFTELFTVRVCSGRWVQMAKENVREMGITFGLKFLLN